MQMDIVIFGLVCCLWRVDFCINNFVERIGDVADVRMMTFPVYMEQLEAMGLRGLST